jgi:hypothetical protein
MENKQELKQRSVESYFEEFNVQEDKKEKILMAITNMVYKMNQRIIKYEKEIDESKKVDILKIINENEVLIKQKIQDILSGKEDTINYDY